MITKMSGNSTNCSFHETAVITTQIVHLLQNTILKVVMNFSFFFTTVEVEEDDAIVEINLLSKDKDGRSLTKRSKSSSENKKQTADTLETVGMYN